MEPGTGESMTLSTNMVPVGDLYCLGRGGRCEQEYAVGYVIKYGEEDELLGEILQRAPFQVGDKGNPAWRNRSLSRGMKDEKRQPDQEGRDRPVCVVCTALSPLGHFRFVCHKLSCYILVS